MVLSHSGYDKLVDVYLGETGHVLMESHYISSRKRLDSVIVIVGIWIDSKDFGEKALDSILVRGGRWYYSRHGVA